MDIVLGIQRALSIPSIVLLRINCVHPGNADICYIRVISGSKWRLLIMHKLSVVLLLVEDPTHLPT